MKRLVQKFRKHVQILAANPAFVHHKWYNKYHLEIVERIAIELCQRYKKADKDLVILLVWMHDYGKIALDNNTKDLIKAKKALQKIGFEEETIKKAAQYIESTDRYESLNQAPIEVKIISSADAAAHLVGPFYSLWWYENPQKRIEDLIDGDIKKALKDWNKKIVLPEIKKTFRERHRVLLEQRDILNHKFLK